MTYEPTRGVYRYIDEESEFQHQTRGHRAKQVLPRRDILTAAEAKRQTEMEARQRNLRTHTRMPPTAYPNVRQRTERREEEEELEEDEYDDEYPPRQHTSAVRYTAGTDGLSIPEGRYTNGNTQLNVTHASPPPAKPKHAIPPRRTAQQELYPNDREQEREHTRPQRPKIRYHPAVWLGLGMIVMILLWLGFSNLSNWWQIHQDDSTYGRPRTFQTDEVVGHNDSTTNPSHFIAVNLNRHVIVIELPGGDPTKARIYPITTLFGDGQELTPVTITFQDVTGTGQLDMIIHIQDQKLVMINENGTFRPLKAGEHIHL